MTWAGVHEAEWLMLQNDHLAGPHENMPTLALRRGYTGYMSGIHSKGLDKETTDKIWKIQVQHQSN
jgi:hypothetical protein